MLAAQNIGTANADTPIYAVPGAKTRAAITLHLVNRNGTAVTFRVAVTAGSGTAPAADGANYLEYDRSLAANESVDLTGLVLKTNQALFVRCNALNAMSAVVYGIEE